MNKDLHLKKFKVDRSGVPNGSIPLSGKPNELHTLHALDALYTLIFYLSILIFIIGFGFRDTPTPFGWYQQFMPNLNGRSITDVFFLDSLSGWAVTNATGQNTDTIFVLKTTNSGDNWMILYRNIGQWFGGYQGYQRVYFLNQNIGYTCDVVSGFAKTTDGGISWSYLTANNAYVDMSILNIDTQWLVSSNSLTGGVFRTTNGGLSWITQYSAGGANPTHIYMYNARMGFMDGGGMKRTTDGGFTWTQIPGEGLFSDMYFIDSLTGWYCIGNMKKTTDGGLTWIQQTLPSGINILTEMLTFSNVNTDTLWGVGGSIFFNTSRGIIYRTYNGGTNWVFQLPDTIIHIGSYRFTDFNDHYNGWAYSNSPTGVHTVTGGDTIFYTGFKNHNSNVPNKFILYQNYPNPFNPATKIKYSITSNVKRETSNIRIVIYNITGQVFSTLVNQKQVAGEYEITFNGSELASGVYFYSLIVDGVLIDSKKMILLK